MRIDNKKYEEVMDGYKAFQNRFNRRPSVDELASLIAWKKSTVRHVVDKLVLLGKMKWDLDEHGERVYKSLQLV